MKRLGSCFAISLFLAVCCSLPQKARASRSPLPMSEARKPAPPAGPLMITFGDKSATWTAATLAALPHTTVTVHNEHTKADETYSGVPLIDLA